MPRMKKKDIVYKNKTELNGKTFPFGLLQIILTKYLKNITYQKIIK